MVTAARLRIIILRRRAHRRGTRTLWSAMLSTCLDAISSSAVRLVSRSLPQARTKASVTRVVVTSSMRPWSMWLRGSRVSSASRMWRLGRDHQTHLTKIQTPLFVCWLCFFCMWVTNPAAHADSMDRPLIKNASLFVVLCILRFDVVIRCTLGLSELSLFINRTRPRRLTATPL